MVVVTSMQRDVINDAVMAMYTAVAREPATEFHFPTGRRACELVGYPAVELDGLPPEALESFAGVGYPFAADGIGSGDSVLDIGSGSGTDVLIARARTGPGGRVYALDMTEAMRAKLRRILDAEGIDNVEVIAGSAEEIPLPDASVDVVTSNGVINLVPDKAAAVREIARVLRPGGRVQIADIALAKHASESCRSNPELWAECIVGATTEEDYLASLRAEGFEDVQVLERRDYFAASPSAETREVAGSLGAIALVLTARKP